MSSSNVILAARGGVYYHVTPKSRVASILKRGLKVGSEKVIGAGMTDSGFRSRRTYTHRTPEDADITAEMMIDMEYNETGRSIEMALLRLDLPPSIRMYRELDSVDGPPTFVALQSIPPGFVSYVNDIDYSA